MLSVCFTQLKSPENQKTNSNGDLLRKAYFWKRLILADISNVFARLVCLLQNMYSLQSFKKHDYEQKDYQRINYRRVSGTIIKSNSSCLVCLVSSQPELNRKKALFVFFRRFCAVCYSAVTTQTWEWYWSSVWEGTGGGGKRTSIFPKIMNIAVFVLRRAGRPSGREETAV